MTDCNVKLDLLRRIVRSYYSCLVAYSGGIDSALVLAIAREQLGDRAIGCIGISPSFPQRERESAIAFAKTIGAQVRLVEPNEHLKPDYLANNSNRCYYCKTSLFDTLKRIAREEGWQTIADGTHLDDVNDHAHGIRAATEHNVRSPLRETSLRKSDIRDIARMLNLNIAEKPAVACLASRIPHGTAVTPALLRRIEQAENVLAQFGLNQFRVRHHGDVARIEVPEEEMSLVIQYRAEILRGIRATGYRYVTLDLLAFHESAHLTPLTIHSELPMPIPVAGA